MKRGYKAFNKDKTNRFGVPFHAGRLYSTRGPIKFGNEGNGYHFCSSIADIFRYVDASSIDNYVVAEVIGFGDFHKYDDEYEGYYDMYSFRHIFIKRFIKREEVFKMISELTEWQLIKVIKTSKLLDYERDYLLEKHKNNISVYNALLYYQYGIKDVYEEYYRNGLKKVLINGQNNSKRS